MKPRIGWPSLTVPLVVLASVFMGLPTTPAAAAECSNTQIRQVELQALELPDCRAYEQVSPVAKNLTDPQGTGGGQVWASPSGEGVTFFSLLPLPIGAGAGEFPTYLSNRDQESERWTYEGLLPPSNPGPGAAAFAITENLETSLVSVGREGPILAMGAQPERPDYYIHTNGTDSYQFLAPGEVTFADSTPDGLHIIFEDKAKLTANAGEFEEEENATNLYEWENGKVSLVGVLPHEEVPVKGGSVAGAGGAAFAQEEAGESPGQLPGGATSRFYTRDTVSEDGARVFFTDVETGRIYMREPQANPPKTIEVSSGPRPAYWRGATPDGSYALYTEGEGGDRNLYRFSASTGTSEALTTGAAHVLGTLGISNDGSYVYFVAEAKLANGATAGRANLYELHVGEAPVAIASLGVTQDLSDWTYISLAPGPAQQKVSSRIAPDGETVLFTSTQKLTNYENAGWNEIYLFNAKEDRLSCVSCNPSGAAASSEAQLTDHPIQGPPSANASLTRNLSDEGNRVFFQTAESLLPEDTNGQTDIYEWEQEGTNSCAAGGGDGSGGCLYLISTGRSPSESYFGDASASGNNVFFFTRQSLVAQDRDENADLYDAREDGGFASQNREPETPCTGEEGCRGPLGSALVFGEPSSATLFRVWKRLTASRNPRVDPSAEARKSPEGMQEEAEEAVGAM